jgi:hypothetical protein
VISRAKLPGGRDEGERVEHRQLAGLGAPNHPAGEVERRRAARVRDVRDLEVLQRLTIELGRALRRPRRGNRDVARELVELQNRPQDRRDVRIGGDAGRRRIRPAPPREDRDVLPRVVRGE